MSREEPPMVISARLFSTTAMIFFTSGLLPPAHAQNSRPTYALADTLHLPGPTRWDVLTFDAPHHRLFITHGDSVDVLDAQAKTIVATIANLSGVHAVALAPEFNKASSPKARPIASRSSTSRR
jgi:hypothetical protein